MANKLFYTITINKNNSQAKNLLYLSKLKNRNTSSIFFNKSLYIASIDNIDTYKILFLLYEPKLYYKENYKYFNEFRNMYDNCIILFNSLNDGNYLLTDNYSWEIEKINSFVTSFSNIKQESH
jgi:hypothetical protein